MSVQAEDELVTISRRRGRYADLPASLRERLRDRLHVAELRRRPRTIGARLLLTLALVGPGVLVMLGDNDAGGVITYAQTGATYGIGFFLPLTLLLGIMAYVVQEMTIRLGAVTRRGHAELIWKRYGPFWGAFSLIDLVAANVLTLMTEFIGIRVGSAVFGLSPFLTVPIAVAFVAFTLVFLRYWTWERIALFMAVLNMVFVPIAVASHPDWAAVGRAFGDWGVSGGMLTASFLVVVSANIGTTIAPWQLFFQQSSVVDKGLLPQDIPAGRRDLALGVGAMVLVASAIIVITGQTIHGLPGAQNFQIEQILTSVRASIGETATALFALGLVEAGLVAAIVITTSTCWAIGEAFDLPRSLNEDPRQALGFYLPGILGTVAAGIVVLLPNVPLGFLNLLVQVVATIFMPAAMLFLLMLLNDRELMGEHVNTAGRNALALGIMAFLILCNGLFGIATLFPRLL